MKLQVDKEELTRRLQALASFSASPAPSVTRIVFSEPDLNARRFVKELFSDAGLTVRQDAAGNMFGCWPGSEPTLPPVATGSHIDAIPEAGAYDGTVGVLGAVEAVRTLRRAGFRPRRSIEVVLFTSEEPTRFGVGCLGSRLLSGTLDPERADLLEDAAGATLRKVRENAGFLGELRSVQVNKGHYAAFLELHIEQGPLLERERIEIGAVTHIAAPASLRVVLDGEGGHAGAVLMPDRRDALVGGAELALAVESEALKTGAVDSVATTGIFQISPGAVNSIPSRAQLGIDVRDTEESRRNGMIDRITAAAHAIAARRKLRAAVETLNADPPAMCDPHLVSRILQAAKEAGLRAIPMVSRAYHDTLFMARIAPVSMIFIPCRNGVSHRPDEYAAPEAIAAGVEVLARVLAEVARA